VPEVGAGAVVIPYINAGPARAGYCAVFFCGLRLAVYLRHPAAGRHDRGRAVEYRRVNQHGVLPQQATRGPAGLEDEIQVGFQHRVFGADEDTGAAVIINLHIEADTGEEVGAIHAHFLEIFGGGKPDPDLILVQPTDIE
jgi:hypothetical protein